MTDQIEKKKKKRSGPIRYEAVIPVLIIFILTFAYFSYYFDRHLQKLVEYVGTQANGAEVNIDSINTSFLRGSFDLNRLQVTDKERPTHNSLEIGNIHFQYLWDALLRMKFVVEEASINNVQIAKPRRAPGRVLPPEPAKPSKLNQLQMQVTAQIKGRYGDNVLGDVLKLLEGADFGEQIKTIQGTLKSESRVQDMISDVKNKRETWDAQIKKLTDTETLQAAETQIQALSQEKDLGKQLQAAKKLNESLKQIQNQYSEINQAQKELKSQVNRIQQYPKELQALIEEDMGALKNRFSIPELDFKDMAMHLFAPKFAGHIADARKYQALAKKYMPAKKEKDEEPLVPRPRAEGEYFEFPTAEGYPLFWLKRAAISSKGTLDSYSGNVSGELTNVTTDPAQIRKPAVLDLNGDFPAAKVMGVKALVTLDHTKEVAEQSALLQVNSFAVPEQLFTSDEQMKLGFANAVGSTTLTANLVQERVNINWNSALAKPEFIIETKSPEAKKILSNILSGIPVININGRARGTFDELKMDITSNIGQELAQGLSKEIGNQVAAAQARLRSMLNERINQPREQLLAQIGMSDKHLKQLEKAEELYKKNEARIKAELARLQKSEGSQLKEKGKKLLKGIKL